MKKQATTPFFISKSFSTTRKPAFAHFGDNEKKKTFDVICCLYKMKQSYRLLCAARNCDWSRNWKSRHCQTWPKWLLWKENLQRNQNWTAKSTNVSENAWKLEAFFVIRATLWAEKLGCCLEYCCSWKNSLGNLAVTVKEEAIWFEFWMKGALATVKICVLCTSWFLNQFKTPYSCDARQLAVSCAELSAFLAVAPWDGLVHLRRKARLFMPTGPALNHFFVWSDPAFKLLLTAK